MRARAFTSPVMGSTRVRSINGSGRTEGTQVMGGRPRYLKLPPRNPWLVLALPGLGSALPSGLLIAVKLYVVSSSQPKMTHPELITSPCCPAESSETPSENSPQCQCLTIKNSQQRAALAQKMQRCTHTPALWGEVGFAGAPGWEAVPQGRGTMAQQYKTARSGSSLQASDVCTAVCLRPAGRKSQVPCSPWLG